MNVLKKVALLSTLVLAFPLTAAAEGEMNPWRDCGIGGAIFDETPVGAVISNIIWDLGTTAVTSQASSPDTCEGKTYKTALFIQQSYANLEEETVKGSGKHLDAMLTMLGCENAAHPEIVNAIRADFSEMVSRDGYSAESVPSKAEAYYNNVYQKVNGTYAQQCNIG
jgi:hypothetical protein